MNQREMNHYFSLSARIEKAEKAGSALIKLREQKKELKKRIEQEKKTFSGLADIWKQNQKSFQEALKDHPHLTPFFSRFFTSMNNLTSSIKEKETLDKEINRLSGKKSRYKKKEDHYFEKLNSIEKSMANDIPKPYILKRKEV